MCVMIKTYERAHSYSLPLSFFSDHQNWGTSYLPNNVVVLNQQAMDV